MIGCAASNALLKPGIIRSTRPPIPEANDSTSLDAALKLICPRACSAAPARVSRAATIGSWNGRVSADRASMIRCPACWAPCITAGLLSCPTTPRPMPARPVAASTAPGVKVTPARIALVISPGLIPEVKPS
jgi:hypothetical protein